MFNVVLKKKILRAARSMPKKEQELFQALVVDIRLNGPVRTNWRNYGVLEGTNTHHCHLSYHWAACWYETVNGVEVEVTYVGSRENAPY